MEMVLYFALVTPSQYICLAINMYNLELQLADRIF